MHRVLVALVASVAGGLVGCDGVEPEAVLRLGLATGEPLISPITYAGVTRSGVTLHGGEEAVTARFEAADVLPGIVRVFVARPATDCGTGELGDSNCGRVPSTQSS